MKKRKGNPLLIAVGVLAVLGVAYVGIVQGKAEHEKKQEAEKEYIIKMEHVAELSLKHNGETLEFVKAEDGTWSYKKDTEFPLKQTEISNLESAVSALEPVRVLDGAEEMGTYGLEEPESWVLLTDADGTVKKLLLGDVTDNNYYACVEGESTVYTISSSVPEDLPDDLYDWISLESFPYVSSTSVVNVQVEKADGTGYLLEKEEKEVPIQSEAESDADADAETDVSLDAGKKESPAESSEADTNGTTEGLAESTEQQSVESVQGENETEADAAMETVTEWYVTGADGVRRKMEASGTADTVVSGLTSLYVTSCANYKAAEEELGTYGLSNPTVIMYQYQTADADAEGDESALETVKFEVGSLDETGSCYYVRMQDSKAVNLISAEKLDTILEKTPENFE